MSPIDQYQLVSELHERALKLLEAVRPCPAGSRRWGSGSHGPGLVTIGESSHNIAVCIGIRLSEVYSWRKEDHSGLDTPRYHVSYRLERVQAALRVLRELMVLDDIASV